MQTEFIIFVFLALATLVGAASVALSRNIFWSAMGLLSSLVGVGGLYVMLSADFVAVTQVLIYIGGGLVGGYAVFFVTATLLSFVAIWAPWKLTDQPAISETTAAIGNGLLGTWLLPFEIVSVVLVATLVGAIVIARKEVKAD